MQNCSGQAMIEYVVAVVVIVVFLSTFIASRSPLNLILSISIYQNSLENIINSSTP